MKITLIAHPHNAPCCVQIAAQDGRNLLIQTDWDFPAVATNFGWSITKCQQHGGFCEHNTTDGTITCPICELRSSDFIASARQWIDDHDGETADDPGYFA